MSKTNPASLDLNLIRVFLAVWDARSLTDAGERLHLTQPAVSHALKRLRDEFNDPLFVRVANAMVPTEAASRLEGPVRQALAIIHRAVHEHGGFDPASSDRSFRIAMSDVSAFVLLPALLAKLEKCAPGVQLESVRVDPSTVSAQLRTGEIDLALGFLPDLEEGCLGHLLLKDSCVCLLRAGHPLADAKLDAEDFAKLRFVYAGSGAPGHLMTERWLDQIGIKRTIALRVAHFTIAPEIVKQTDLAVVFPLSMAKRVNQSNDFCLLSIPGDTQDIDVKVHTHVNFSSDSGINWLRDLMTGLFATEN
jgi:DNA-binding transcriptional LysR family regulator